jgi:heme/copper-type cytochrome/quinol oxidase subunit 2
MITTKTLEFGTKRLLDVDNRLVLPTDTMIKTLVTSVDVLHAFAVPQLGFKVDAVPGRLNQILLYINRVGVYYGQCSELCGIGHGFMPIVIDAYTPDEFCLYLKQFERE